jgi:hypothetical protein
LRIIIANPAPVSKMRPFYDKTKTSFRKLAISVSLAGGEGKLVEIGGG